MGRARGGFAGVGAYTDPAHPRAVTAVTDPLGRVTTSTDWASNTTSFDFDPDGRLVEVLSPTGGQVDAYGYDRAGRMESVTMTAGAATLADIAYTRDPAGRLTGEDHSGLPDPDRTWGHDDLGRLSDQDTTPTWAYDDADNLTATTDGTAQAFDAANQLCAAGATAGTCAAPASGATVFDYDNAGNRLSADPAAGPAVTYGWDDAHRLTTLDDGATTWTHRWRPDGLLAGTDDTATATGLVWTQHGGLPQPLAETTPTGATSWLYGPDGAGQGQPYAYANNNPLVYTDPTGLIFGAITDAVGDAFDSAVGAVDDAWDATAGRGVTAINDTCFGSWQAAATCTAVAAGGVALGAGGLAALGLAGGLTGTAGMISWGASVVGFAAQAGLTIHDCLGGLDASCIANIAATACGAAGIGLGRLATAFAQGATPLTRAGSLLAGPAAGYSLGASGAGTILGWPGLGGYLDRDGR